LDSSRIAEIYQELGTEYQDRVIQPAEQEVIKAVTARFTAEELITKRPEVATQMQDGLVERLSSRHIIVESISITNFDFSASFNAAIEAKVTAVQKKLEAENDLARIKVEAEQVAAKAKGDRDAAIAQAQGQSESIALVQNQLKQSPQYIEWYRITKWDGVLPIMMSQGGVTPLIDVGGLTK
jgi:regulator of protease activity HflC (stomatin/prohibitin superfamily)